MLQSLLDIFFPQTNYEKKIEKTQYLVFEPTHIRTYSGIDIHSATRDSDPEVHATLRVHKKLNTEHTTKLLATILNDFLLETFAETVFWDNRQTLLVPIPQSRARTRARGFNHLHSLCKELSPELQLCVRTDILIQHKNVPMQKTLARKERFENVKNIFSIAPQKNIQGKHICVFDDITTTGATLSSAAKTLTHAGAIVTAVAIARA